MENLDLLGNLGKIAGVAGIALGVLFLTFRSIIQKNIFPNLTKEHAYGIIRLIIIVCTMLAVLGIGAWIYANQQEKDASKIMVRIEGTVTDVAGNPLSNVEVKLADIADAAAFSDSEGHYVLRVAGKGIQDYTLEFVKTNYIRGTKNIAIDFKKHAKEALRADMRLNARAMQPDEEPAIPASNHSIEGGTNPTPNAATSSGITLVFDDEGMGCFLNVGITIGNKTYYPNANPFTITDLPNGTYKYQISGSAQCNAGSCQVVPISQDFINLLSLLSPDAEPYLKYYTDVTIRNGGTYYLMLDPEYCVVGMFDDASYQFFKSVSQGY